MGGPKNANQIKDGVSTDSAINFTVLSVNVLSDFNISDIHFKYQYHE